MIIISTKKLFWKKELIDRGFASKQVFGPAAGSGEENLLRKTEGAVNELKSNKRLIVLLDGANWCPFLGDPRRAEQRQPYPYWPGRRVLYPLSLTKWSI